MPRTSLALAIVLLALSGSGACGGDASPPRLGDAGAPAPRFPRSWTTTYRFPLPDPGGPDLDLGALLDRWVGLDAPPGVAEALDFWLRASAPPSLARFLRAHGALGEEGFEVRIDGAATVDSRSLWSSEAWTTVAVRARCPDGPLRLELDPVLREDLGLGRAAWGPFALRVHTASASTRFSTRRAGRLSLQALRRLRSRAATACAAGAPVPTATFLARAIPCADLREEVGPWGGWAERACDEGLRRVATWIDGGSAPATPIRLELAGVGWGKPPTRFAGEAGAGVDVRVGAWSAQGTFSWVRSDP